MGGNVATMSTAKLLQLRPEAACCDNKKECFDSMYWFVLQDDFGGEKSFPIMSSEWAKLLELIPEPKTPQEALPSNLEIDRVLVKTCKSGPGWVGWGRSCIM